MPRTRDHWAVYFGLREADPPADRARTRASLRSPLWWLILLGLGTAVGAAYEGVAAALGDGSFDLSAIPRVAVPAIVAALGVRVFEALRRSE